MVGQVTVAGNGTPAWQGNSPAVWRKPAYPAVYSASEIGRILGVASGMTTIDFGKVGHATWQAPQPVHFSGSAFGKE